LCVNVDVDVGEVE